jgi:hypothetical protein
MCCRREPAGLWRGAGVILLGAMNYNLSLGHALVFLLAGLGVVTILHTFRNLVLISAQPRPLRTGLRRRHGTVRPGPGQPRGRCPHQPAPVDRRPGARSKSMSGAQPRWPSLWPVARHRRGWLPLPRITIETTWPLGLVRAWSYAGPGLELPGLSGAGRQGAAAALERRFGARHDPRGSRRRRLFRHAQSSGRRCAAPCGVEGRGPPARRTAADQAVRRRKPRNRSGWTGNALPEAPATRAAPVDARALDARCRRRRAGLGPAHSRLRWRRTTAPAPLAAGLRALALYQDGAR